ncbi:MAG: hypothetical protein DSO04_06235 [Hadesarchaea archaeon]|jgi:hypothetical protein|nr:MAG: hypothetical protein DSO04_06235 [Hadesarchaea archaeon]
MEEATKALSVVLVVLVMGMVYLAHDVSTLHERVRELDRTLVNAGVVIDNGEAEVYHEVHLTRGATALEALRRVAVVETKYYAGLGEFIVSINGLSNDPSEGKYWMFYLWKENGWEYAPVGAGSYELREGDNVKFRYERPSW